MESPSGFPGGQPLAEIAERFEVENRDGELSELLERKAVDPALKRCGEWPEPVLKLALHEPGTPAVPAFGETLCVAFR